MTQKFTPGTWEQIRETITDKNGQAHNVYVRGMHIGSYSGEIDLKNEIEQRAALIAAAPDLLKSLNDLMDSIFDTISDPEERFPFEFEQAIKAIKKAEGL